MLQSRKPISKKTVEKFKPIMNPEQLVNKGKLFKIDLLLKDRNFCMHKIPVGILGGTGVVGQHYIHLLQEHPWFEVTFISGSKRSSGKTYEQAVSERWHMPIPIPSSIAKLMVHESTSVDTALTSCKFVFSALSGDSIQALEELYASKGLPVVSNTSVHRMTPDVPMIIPEINPHHLEIIPIQQKKRGWKQGFIVVKPNCSLQSYLMPLTAIHHHSPIESVIITTLQALSGAGHPGVSSMDVIDNVIPFIPGEEEKSEIEPLKILGSIENEEIKLNNTLKFSAQCNRVPVLDGHLASVSLKLKNNVTESEILKYWKTFKGVPQELKLPLAPQQPIHYTDLPARPQPRLDRNRDKGMAVTVGRLRKCPVLDYRFVALSHNTIRGAAGGGILNAELLKARKLI
jgi:aspartate-semialdehyde dehydrogenase